MSDIKLLLQKRINKKHKAFIAEHIHLCEVFSDFNLTEIQGRSREDVVNKINANVLKTTVKEFSDSLAKSAHPDMLSSYSAGELSKMKLFKVPGYNIGYALKPMDNGAFDIVSVHNNEPDVKNIGEALIQSAIKNGGCYLDHFDTPKLSTLYQNMGFDEISRDKFDPQYDPEASFRNKYGEADIIYRKYKNCRGN